MQAVAALPARIFVKYDGIYASSCATRELRGVASRHKPTRAEPNAFHEADGSAFCRRYRGAPIRADVVWKSPIFKGTMFAPRKKPPSEREGDRVSGGGRLWAFPADTWVVP